MKLRAALPASLLLALLAGSYADAAVRERVKVPIPDPGQLAATRLEFKVEGDRTPKLKLKLKNARKLPDEVIAAAQMTRSTERKGRAVALLAIANAPGSATSRTPLRVTGENALIEVAQTGTGTRITDIEFQNAPRSSRTFASVLGLEPGVERRQAQKTFDLPDTRVPDDRFGRLDLSDALEVMDLKLVQESKIVSHASDHPRDLEELFRELGIASGIAAGIGPPAVLDARIYELVTGQPPPLLLDSTYGPSQSDPSYYFVGTIYSFSVMGAQVSQASEIDLLDTPEARCQDGFLNDGVVTRGFGPRLTAELGFRLDCDLAQDHQQVFFDVPLEEAPAPGTVLFRFMPFPYYGTADVGEAVGGPGTTLTIRSQ